MKKLPLVTGANICFESFVVMDFIDMSAPILQYRFTGLLSHQQGRLPMEFTAHLSYR
jgi:hypothetical protein